MSDQAPQDPLPPGHPHPSAMPGSPVPAEPLASPVVIPEKGTSLTADAWRRLRRNRLAVAGALMLVAITLLCVVGPLLSGHDPEATDPKNAFLAPSFTSTPVISSAAPGPSVGSATDGSAASAADRPAHLFGTDSLGRDYFTRVLVGGQTSLAVGLVATLVCLLVGTLYGAVAGYYGGRVDEILMRFVDFFYGIPYMFLVILIMVKVQGDQATKASAVPVFLSLGLVQWLAMARIVRGQVLTLRDQEFVLAARLTGASDGRIILRHILPNVLGIVIIYATLTVPAVILLESFLSFLGLGLELSWGVVVSEAVNVVNPVRSYWWLLLWPSLFLALTLLSLNFLGDGLRDAFDPKSRR